MDHHTAVRERNKRILDLYGQGLPGAEIAARLGVTRRKVFKAVADGRSAGDSRASGKNYAVRPAEWNFESCDRLRQLAAEGLSASEIGRELGVSRSAVLGKARRLGVTIGGGRGPGGKVPHANNRRGREPDRERREHILTLRAAGKTDAEIAEVFGIDRSSVSKAVARSRRDGDPRAAYRPAPAPKLRPVPRALPVGPEPTEGLVAFPNDVRLGQCRWPMWADDAPPATEKMVCGRAVDGGSVYCGHHRLRGTVAAPARHNPAPNPQGAASP